MSGSTGCPFCQSVALAPETGLQALVRAQEHQLARLTNDRLCVAEGLEAAMTRIRELEEIVETQNRALARRTA